MKNSKKFFVWCVILIVAGCALSLFAHSEGADTSFRLTKSGFAARETEEIVCAGMEAFDIVRLRADAGSVAVVAGAEYSYRVTGFAREDVEIVLTDGMLTISVSDAGFPLFPFSFFGNDEARVVVTVPGEARLKEISAEVSSGKVLLDGVQAESVLGSATSGEVALDNVTAYQCSAVCASGAVRLHGTRADVMRLCASSGRVEGDELTALGLSASVTSGDIRLAGRFEGVCDVCATSGYISLDIAAPASAYNRSLTATSGVVRVMGKRAEGAFGIPGVKNTLAVTVTSGAADVRFAEE